MHVLYFNFRPDKYPDPLSLPPGGVMLDVVGAPLSLKSAPPGEWALIDADRSVPESYVEKTIHLEKNIEINKLLWTEFDLRGLPSAQSQHQVNVYWTYQGRLFAIHFTTPAASFQELRCRELVAGLLQGLRPLKAR
jgi:hypothetical protein